MAQLGFVDAQREGAARRRRAVARTGFAPANATFHRAYNLALSTALLVLVAPLIAAISALLLATQGRSVFYFGPRVGLEGRTFHIVKFRTLDGEKAKLLTRDGVLPPGTGIETPLGGFLRDTRLDELPQLLNVVMGDMNLCGPRPVRAEIAAILRGQIPDYDRRFAVKPGLVGHTQAFMNHGTSKAIRARYNALLVRSPVRYGREIALVALIGLCVLARGADHSLRRLRDPSGARASAEQRRRAASLDLGFVPDGGGAALPAAAVDDACVWLRAGAIAPFGTGASGAFRIRLPDGRIRRARVRLDPLGGDGFDDATAYRYTPATDFAFHIVTRYLLQKVVVPHRSQLAAFRLLSILPSRRRAVAAAPSPAGAA